MGCQELQVQQGVADDQDEHADPGTIDRDAARAQPSSDGSLRGESSDKRYLRPEVVEPLCESVCGVTSPRSISSSWRGDISSRAANGRRPR